MVPLPAPSLRRDVLLVVLALFLLAMPFWIGQFDFDADRYTYERTEVGVESGTIEYVEPTTGQPPHLPISDDLGCETNIPLGERRLCAFESDLAQSNRSVVTGYTKSHHNASLSRNRAYRYMQFNDGLYEQLTRYGNSTVSPSDLHGEWYPMYLDVRQVDPGTALHKLSVDASRDSVPDVVRRAAESGEATTSTDADVPVAPIRLDDGTHFRVYESDVSDPPTRDRAIYVLGRYLAPLFGLGTLYVVSRNLTVGYTAGRSGPSGRS